MNLNELFFFKVFPCMKSTKDTNKDTTNNNNNLNQYYHNEKYCYFYHTSTIYENSNIKMIEKDRRREPILFSKFFKKLLSKLKDEENYSLSLESLFEFKSDENYFNYYIDSMPFDSINEKIYLGFDCCHNLTEFNYHMNRYKANFCRFFKINKKCKNIFCYGKHKYNNKIDNESDKENNNVNNAKTIINNIINNINKDNEFDINEGIIKYRNIINKWKDEKEIKLKQIIDLYNYILSFDNKYLLNNQLNDINKFFNVFQKWYCDIQTKNFDKNINLKSNEDPYGKEEIFNKNYNEKSDNFIINHKILKNYQSEEDMNSNEVIINDIYKSIKLVNDASKIYSNNNLLGTLKINTNVCYISKYNKIKKAEIVKYVYAMINSSDGVIIYGGHENNNSIKGISMNRKERDKFKIWFNSEFIKILIKYEDNLKYNFYDLANDTNDKCVLVIEIKKIKSHKFLIKLPAKYLIIKEKFLNRNKNEKNKLLCEENVKELDLREYHEILRKKLLEHYSEKFKVKI